MNLKEAGIIREDLEWYTMIVLVSALELIVYILGVTMAVYCLFGSQYAILKSFHFSSISKFHQNLIVGNNYRYNYLIMAIVLSNFAKPFLLLTMIWSYGFDFNQLINSFILASNAVAVKGTFCFIYFPVQNLIALGLFASISTHNKSEIFHDNRLWIYC